MADNADAEAGGPPGPGLTSAVRRFPLVVLALALVGAVIGAGVTLVRPATYSATARVVLGTANDVNVYRSVQTVQPAARAQAAAAAIGSEGVRQEASRALGGDVSPSAIRRSLTVVPATNAAIVTITAKRDSGSSAAEVANAVANGYVSVAKAQTQARSARAQATLKAQIATTRTELKGVQDRLAARTSTIEKRFDGISDLADRERLSQGAVRVDPTAIGLTDRSTEISESITALRETLDQTRVDDTLTAAGTDSVYAATAPAKAASGTVVRNTAAGLVLGLVLGVVVAWLMLERRSKREGSFDYVAEEDVAASEGDGIPPAKRRRERTATTAAR